MASSLKLEKLYNRDGNLYVRVFYVTGGEKVYLSKEIYNTHDLRTYIESLKENLDDILKQGEDSFIKHEQEKFKEDEYSPEKLWKKINEMNDNEVFSFFNSLDLEVRKELSSYIMSSVNMFKGKGMLFTQFFNYTTYLLEK